MTEPATPALLPCAIVDERHVPFAEPILRDAYETIALPEANGQCRDRVALIWLSDPVAEWQRVAEICKAAKSAKVLMFPNGDTPPQFKGMSYHQFRELAGPVAHEWNEDFERDLAVKASQRLVADGERERQAYLAAEAEKDRLARIRAGHDPDAPAGAETPQIVESASGPDDDPSDPDDPSDDAADIALASVLEAERASVVFSVEHDPDAWPAPADLWGGSHLPEVQPEWLPAPIADYLLDRAQIRGVDPCQVAVGGMTVCAGLIRESICLHMSGEDKGWREGARLWGAICGDPSVRKGAGDDIAQGTLKDLAGEFRAAEEEAKAEYAIAVKIYEQELAAYVRAKAKGDPANRPSAPEKRPSNRLWTENATTEAVALLLQNHARGKIMLLKDELAGWFGSFDAYGNGKSDKDRPDWLSAYEGKERYIDRARDGGSAIHVPSWSVGILGGIQPSVLANVAAKLGHDGMLQRFQIVCSRAAGQGEERQADRTAADRWERLHRNLLELQYGADHGPIRLSPEAQAFRSECSKWLAQAMRAGLTPSLQAALGKWDGLLGRLVITAHCINAADEGRPFPDRQVPLATVHQCWAYIQRLLWPHAVHFYQQVVGGDDKHQPAQWVAGLILSKGLSEISTTYLSRNWYGYRNLKTGPARAQLWDALITAGWLRPDRTAGQDRDLIGKLPTRYIVNPAVHDGRFDEQKAEYMAQRAHYTAVMRDNMPSAAKRIRDPGEED